MQFLRGSPLKLCALLLAVFVFGFFSGLFYQGRDIEDAHALGVIADVRASVELIELLEAGNVERAAHIQKRRLLISLEQLKPYRTQLMDHSEIVNLVDRADVLIKPSSVSGGR